MTQLLAQLLKHIPSSKCPCKPLFLHSVSHISARCDDTNLSRPVFMAHVPATDVCVQNNSFIVIFLLFESRSHLYLSLWFPPCFTTEGDKRQIKALLPCSVCLSRHKAPLCGCLSVCPGPDYSWQRH